MSLKTSNGHGGKRQGAGRKKKITPPMSPLLQPSMSSTSHSNIQQSQRLGDSLASAPSLFFTGRGITQSRERVSEPNLSSFRTQPSVISQSDIDHLRSEVEEVMNNDEHAEVRIREGRIIDESISDSMDDSSEANAEAAEAETKDSEVRERSVNHQYLLDYRNSLQKQVAKYGTPKCYKEGQFFVHPPHPVFALHQAAHTSFSPDPLCLCPIFVWLPQYLPGRPDLYKCECGSYLTLNGYNDDPIARRIRTSTGQDYYLFTNRFICDSRRKNNPGCGTSYQGSDLHVLAQLPRWIQQAFPAFLTSRSAVDKLVIDLMKPCFAGRFGPEPFSKMLLELQALQHSRRELTYLAAARHYGLFGRAQVPEFPKFGDPMKYAGSVPSVRYIKSIWTDYHSGIKIYEDRVQASLSGFKLAGDHTFRIMKAMARLKSEPIFGALFSLVNEWEEIRAQAMTLTKGFSILPEMFKQVSIGLKEHGQQPTALYYCDNPTSERDFHERVTESLAVGVQHVISEPGKNLPKFMFNPGAPVVEYFDNSMLINNACEEILEHMEGLSVSEQLIVGLSTCCISGSDTLKSIQLRTPEKILIFHVIHLHVDNIPTCLRSLLTSPRIIKVGCNIEKSAAAISMAFSLVGFNELLHRSSGPFLDLGKFAKVKGFVSDPCASPSSIVPAVLKKQYPPITETFSETPASEEETNTLAIEVECIWQTYVCLSRQSSVGLQLQCSDAKVGQLVTVVLARKEIAQGTILEHNGSAEFVMDENAPKLSPKLPPPTLSFKLMKFLFQGRFSPNTRRLSSGCLIMVERLFSLMGIPAPSPAFPTGSDLDLSIGSTQQIINELEAQVEVDSINLDDEHSSDSDENDLDSVGLASTYKELALTFFWSIQNIEEDENMLTSEERVVDTLQHCQNLLVQYAEESQTVPTRVFDDIFHFMDRLLRTLPKSHSAFKEFTHLFSETILIRDANDTKAVKAVLEKKNIPWKYIVRSRKDWLNHHVRRYVPAPSKLEADLTRLFSSFQDVVCSSDRKKGRGRFFSKDSRKVCESLLDSVHRGFLSDPPGIPLYHIKGWDKDGLPLYRTIRGTNSIEGGVHMTIRRIFGSLRASPELSVSLLSNWVLRRNKRVGYLNRTGKKWTGHFDIWLDDEIVELAVSVNTAPSFPIPPMLATRIATSESFGIIPIPPLLAKEYNISTLPPRRIEGVPHHRDMPSHLLVRLSTTITSPYRYLQLCQRAIYPVIPIHTRAEYDEFRRFLGLTVIRNNRSNVPPSQAWKGIDYVKFAQLWNLKVETQDPSTTDSNQRLYYKLPEQLQRHHKKSLEWQTSRATMSLGSNVEKVKDHLATLADPERVAHVLPAICLEDTSSQVDPTVDGLRGLDLTSFNPMALRYTDPQGHEHLDADFERTQQYQGFDPNTEPTSTDNAIDPPPSHNEADIRHTSSVDSAADFPPPRNEAHTAAQLIADTQVGIAQYQATLSFGFTSDYGQQTTATLAGSKKRRKRGCAICREFDCPQADSCGGSGGRSKCYLGPCNHPNIGLKRVRK
ncbi:hypothetical protein BDP27DRAFT_1424992 [Rhodocollybia butyracea]|uniref:DUF6729 domain-containing protein n=1 Tax=Rhodocollybia butyracea TaxID=206335 RepID=A0A9P5PMN3_9AGAR|nr:hypothetical protein BDP27DRAFT_1424992 [Rhodocollybia butyracea]